MLMKFGGHELDVRAVRFTDDEDVNKDYIGLVFMDDTTPELKGQTLIIGDMQDKDDKLQYQAYFDNDENSDALIKQYENAINDIVVDIITHALENTKDANNDSN